MVKEKCKNFCLSPQFSGMGTIAIYVYSLLKTTFFLLARHELQNINFENILIIG